MSPAGLFADRVAILATMHHKEKAIAPILSRLGLHIEVPLGLDTDRFGTFTRDIQRVGNQRQAAKAKAEAALQLTGESLAIASEGSFGPHPLFPVPCNREIVLWLDRQHNLEIVGEALSLNTNYRQQTVRSTIEAQQFAQAVGFPSHGLVALIGANSRGGDRLGHEERPIIKGIDTEARLMEVITLGLEQAETVTLETDMRAHYNPTRMTVIAEATQDLLRKLLQPCPHCGSPGYDVTERRPGLPCGLCGSPTERTLLTLSHCQHCGFQQESPFPEGLSTADPAHCPWCNP